MTVFGWLTVGIWVLLAVAKGTDTLTARLLCIAMVIGTLAWGTGSL